MKTEPMSADSQILPKVWNIPEVIRARTGREAGTQRAIFEDGHLLIVLHVVPGPDDLRRKAALFWRQPHGEWKSNLEGQGIAALQKFMLSYEAKLTELDEAEHVAATAAEYHSVLERLAPVVRSSRGMHRAMQQARELAKTDRELVNLRDQASAIERTADLLLQDAQFGLNFTVARQAESQAADARKMAATAHKLNLLAAIFLPITALASIFGMEIHSGWADTPAHFLVILAAGLVMGCALGVLIARGK